MNCDRHTLAFTLDCSESMEKRNIRSTNFAKFIQEWDSFYPLERWKVFMRIIKIFKKSSWFMCINSCCSDRTSRLKCLENKTINLLWCDPPACACLFVVWNSESILTLNSYHKNLNTTNSQIFQIYRFKRHYKSCFWR